LLLRYGIFKSYDYAGFWEGVPSPPAEKPYGTVLAIDMLLTTVAVVFFTALLVNSFLLFLCFSLFVS
jgi:hypothetical protein